MKQIGIKTVMTILGVNYEATKSYDIELHLGDDEQILHIWYCPESPTPADGINYLMGEGWWLAAVDGHFLDDILERYPEKVLRGEIVVKF